MTDRPAKGGRLAGIRRESRGQALVLFALFLLVLLGASALAIDYANWLLIDRRLQNVADHAALAGASVFDQSSLQTDCGANPTLCGNARAQAWASLSQDLSLGLDDSTTIACLAAQDTPGGPSVWDGGWKKAGDAGCTGPDFGGHTIWVSTPPPANASYTGVGGRYALNHAVVFVRVDEPTNSYLGRALGVGARDRIGWATAGPLPSDFALQIFCRNNIAPQSGACGGSGATALVIDGQGGIRLIRGDIGSNESLKVTATNGGGVVVRSGHVFLVNGSCSNALWRCPNGPPSLGGISDGFNGQNPFYMPPQPIPHYQSPLWDVSVSDRDCTGANATHLCVPYRGAYVGSPNQAGDWACTFDPTDVTKPLCGIRHDYVSGGAPVSGSVRCDASTPAPDGFLDTSNNHYHMHATADLGNNPFHGHNLGPQNIYRNIADLATPMIPDTAPNDWVYTNDGASGVYRTQLSQPPGLPDPGFIFLRWIPFRTISDGDVDTAGGGNAVTVSVELDEQRIVGGTTQWVAVAGAPTDTVTLTSGAAGPFAVREVQIAASAVRNFNALSLKFTVTTTNSNGQARVNNRGAAISWAELETTYLSPALPALIPPGYYHSISVPDGGCAVMDPTAAYWSQEPIGNQPAVPLALYQKAGIYRFGGGSDAYINVGSGSFLIGDGVTLVFDPSFPDPTGGRGIVIGANGALVLNTSRVPGVPPCTPTETESAAYNPSQPLLDPNHVPENLNYGLPYSGVCAAWAVDSTNQTGLHAGTMLWTGIDPTTGDAVPYCADTSLAQCISRGRYGATGLPSSYRGITFYFSTTNWPATTVRRRFQMGGTSGSLPGIAFRGVLYAPYDDVKISGGNGFDTVGQVLAWTAKFNGGDSFIDLDYPYEAQPSPPFLLEPGLGQ
jgi:hypothetical protein